MKMFRALLAASLLLALPCMVPAHAQDDPAPAAEDPGPPPVTLTALRVEPERPAPDSLCRLAVTLENRGDQPVSALRFEVEVAGVSLPVYRNQLFMEYVPPASEQGSSKTEIRLYNFWVSETGRAAPRNGKLPVRVTLVEARWLSVGKDEEGVEVWTLLDTVPGTPSSVELTLPLAAPAAARPATPPPPSSPEPSGGQDG